MPEEIRNQEQAKRGRGSWIGSAIGLVLLIGSIAGLIALGGCGKSGSGTVVKNSTGMEFVLVPAGSFMMGSDKSDAEKPAHQVKINSQFYLGKYEVTQAQWQKVMGSNPSFTKNCDQCPVEMVSWDDAQEFIKKLNAANDGYTYRLPSEAEWEYACRAGTTGDYAGDVDALGWYSKNSDNKSHPIGQKQANAFGLYDMHGNVVEWCEDVWHENYNGAPGDGSAWKSGDSDERVLRGGWWNSDANSLRSAYRDDSPSGGRLSYFGFRVVAVPQSK